MRSRLNPQAHLWSFLAQYGTPRLSLVYSMLMGQHISRALISKVMLILSLLFSWKQSAHTFSWIIGTFKNLFPCSRKLLMALFIWNQRIRTTNRFTYQLPARILTSSGGMASSSTTTIMDHQTTFSFRCPHLLLMKWIKTNKFAV